ncbi:RNA 2',3'-cyclic phosphodiesterase, partial [Patescibacteria group bacterium]|nr:RNA 2',3'-cyclic phosphodiesterase [Patescibacteria group bacterium]
MRLFISINVPGELHRHCKQLQSQFPEMKNTNEFHITIQFLGDDIESEEKIIEKLNKIRFEPFEIQMGDAVPFGNPNNPRGIWIECKENPQLTTLASNIRQFMGDLGYKADHPFRTHITLGR